MASHVYKYSGYAATVRWDRRRCVHAAECVHGLPEVFEQNRRPWIDPDRAGTESLAEVVRRCPSGALVLEIHESGEPELRPAENGGRVVADGPLYLTGDLRLATAGGRREEVRIALCRCGESHNKPYCDNSHINAGFSDRGAIGELSNPVAGKGPLSLTPVPNGPVLAEGPLTLRDSADRVRARTGRAALCRCGHSRNKPFCDGSHKDAGFSAE